jgi:hypothetical protein
MDVQVSLLLCYLESYKDMGTSSSEMEMVLQNSVDSPAKKWVGTLVQKYVDAPLHYQVDA